MVSKKSVRLLLGRDPVTPTNDSMALLGVLSKSASRKISGDM